MSRSSRGGPALEEREQFLSYRPETGLGHNVQGPAIDRHDRCQHGPEPSNCGLSDTSSPTAYSPSHPPTPPTLESALMPPIAVTEQQVATNGFPFDTKDMRQSLEGFHPATLAQKLAAHEASSASSQAGSVGKASSQATFGDSTPRSDIGTPPIGTPAQSRIASNLLPPNAQSGRTAGQGDGSNESSAFSSRVSTVASDFSPHQEVPDPAIVAAGKPLEKEPPSSPIPLDERVARAAAADNKERSASPSKPRPAVFSAITPKDKESPVVPQRPPMPEKKSMLGKMLDGMRSKDNLHKSSPDPSTPSGNGRPRGRSVVSGSEPESGNESDAGSSVVKEKHHFGILGRKMSSGKKENLKEKELFLSEQEKAAAMARGDNRPRSDSRPDLSRRGSHDRKAEESISRRPSVKGERPDKDGMGQSLKDFMDKAPLMHRKSSVTSKKSDDGKSDKGSNYGGDTESQYDGSKKGGSSASLLKKYGACEKQAIGKGATAVVRLAHKFDKTSDKYYAVKEFRKRRKNESEKDYVKKLTSEFCISSTLHHPNVVETVDLVQDENHHWCEVMEYCPGGDLYAAIKRGELTQAQITSYFYQMVSGVAYLHSMGVAHRDIKPENLLLDANDQIKITDFGVSDVFRMCWEKTCHLSKGLCGSEPYIAPEQFEPKAQYDARLVDVWACAVVFYCMQFQELPWRVAKISDPSFAAFAEAYASTPNPPPLGDLAPRECRTIVKAMLNPDPKHRVGTDGIIKDKWFSSLSPKATSPSAPTPKVVEPSQALNQALGR